MLPPRLAAAVERVAAVEVEVASTAASIRARAVGGIGMRAPPSLLFLGALLGESAERVVVRG